MPDESPSLKPVSMLTDAKLRTLPRVLMQQRLNRPAVDLEAEIDELLEEFEGDARKALGALLCDLDTIVADYEATISSGYVRRGPTLIR